MENLTNNGSDDIFFAKYSDTGNYVYARNIGGASSDQGLGIAANNSRNVYLTGNYQMTADFDPSTGTYNLTSLNYHDIFVARYSEGGNITTNPFSQTQYCNGEEIVVWYSVSSPLNLGNVFTAQLSDNSGSFASPVNIGTRTSNTSGYIGCMIPLSTPPGTGYRIRVVSSDPVIIGSDNRHNLVVMNCCTNPTNGGTIAAEQTVCSGDSPDSFTSVSLPTSHTGTLEYQWQKSIISRLTGFNDIVGAVSYTFTETDLLTQTTWYKRLASVHNGAWAGVFMRESNAPSAKTILFKTGFTNQGTYQYRTATNGSITTINQALLNSNMRWMKIQRQNNSFKVFTSANGTT